MCIICTKEYDENTTKIWCCPDVTEIPILPKLEYLDCYRTRITKIPLLPELKRLWCNNTRITEIPLLLKLEILHCYNTQITEIPLLPELKELRCSNTQITEIPILKDCKINYNSCEWLNPPKESISLVGKIQNKIRTVNQRRINVLFNSIDTYTDLLHIIKLY